MKRIVGALLLCASTALGQASNGWAEIQNGWGEIQTAAGAVPTGCVASSVPIFLGSPVAMGCDAGLTYDAGTNILLVDGNIDGMTMRGRYATSIGDGLSFIATNAVNSATRWYANVGDTGSQKMISGAAIQWVASATDALGGAPDSGLRRVSPGLVGVTSGGSNLGSLQAGNYTATALATPVITSPLTVNGTPGATTYGYRAVAFLNDGTSSAASPEVTIATGPAALGATDNITVAWPAVTGQAYSNLYRTTGGAAPPKLIYSGTAPTYIDVGTEISASAPPATNTTGRVLVGDGSLDAPSVASTSDPKSGIFFEASGTQLSLSVAGSRVATITPQAFSVIAPFEYGGWGTYLTSHATREWQLGKDPSINPLAYTLIVGESGAGTDIPGANGVIQSGAGTGAGAGSTLALQTPVAHASDGVAQTMVTRIGLSSSGVNIPNLATYADNAAATTGGLVAGDLYRTSTGVLMVRY